MKFKNASNLFQSFLLPKPIINHKICSVVEFNCKTGYSLVWIVVKGYVVKEFVHHPTKERHIVTEEGNISEIYKPERPTTEVSKLV